MLNSGIKILALRDKENRYSNSRVERNKAPYPPPLQVKWWVPNKATTEPTVLLS